MVPPKDPPPPSSSSPELPPASSPPDLPPASGASALVASASFAPPPQESAAATSPEEAPVTRAMVSAYMGKRSTLRLILRVVRLHVAKGTPNHVCEAIASDAHVRILESASLPASPAKMDAWLSTLTSRATMDHFRRQAPDLRWLRREVEIEDVRGEAEEEEADPNDAWLLTNWLRERVKGDRADEETLELILEKARTGKTYEQLGAERGVDWAVLGNRVHRFKVKYLPLRHRAEEKRNRMLLLLLLGAVLAGLGWVLWAVLRPAPAEDFATPRARARVHEPRVRFAEDPVFNPAGPTDPTAPDGVFDPKTGRRLR